MSSINITGLPKLELLRRLVLGNSWESSMYVFDEKNAKTLLLRKSYIQYFGGRAIKCDLSQNQVDPSLYNRDAGYQAFEKIVKKMRREIENK